jgi:hypothetical protein
MKIYLSLLFLAIVAAIWLWDWFAVIKGRDGETVSATLSEWSRAWPILPFLIGILIGHLFWPHR